MRSLHPAFILAWTCASSLGAAAAQPPVPPPMALGRVSQPHVPYTFRPKFVHSTTGAVSNANALTRVSDPYRRKEGSPSASLSANSSIILDFGLDVGGYPVFEVSPAILGDHASIRYTVSESLVTLVPGVGDGSPYKGQAGTRYRYETIPVSGGGERWLGRAIQGGQRFLLIEHVAGKVDVVINDLGFEAATDVTPIGSLPGSFNSSDEFLNDLWTAGARTVQLGCSSRGSLTPSWQVSAIGTLIESQSLAIYEKSGVWGQIDFSLSIYIISGSTFTINKGSEYALYPGSTQFSFKLAANNTSTFFGSSGAPVDLPIGALSSGRWHDLKFTVRGDINATVTANLDGVQIGSISYENVSSKGPLGFATGDNTAVIIKDLLVRDIDGGLLYSNSLTSLSALADFATGTNHYGVCFDGAKRDRVVWAGDFAIFGPTIFYSTANIDVVAGSLLLFTGMQKSDGQLASAVLATTNPSGVPADDWDPGNFYAFIYAISAVNAWYEWYQYTGDVRFIDQWWPAIKRDLEYGRSFLDPASGLINVGPLSSYNFNYYDGPTPGTHISANAILVWALRNAALVADSLGDPIATEYRLTASKIEVAVNKHLFSDEQGAYILTEGDDVVGISQDGNAASYAILSGIASAASAPSSPRAVTEGMKSLNTPFGPLSFSNTTRFTPVVSPYASGFHTWAAFEAGMDQEAIDIMRVVWKNQTDVDNPWYTGMTWEFINGTSGEPYNSLASSQAHGWGSGPTWQLSRYVLGIAPAAPGYSTWSFAPRTVNPTFANGRVPTPWGTIVASWEDRDSDFHMHITAPAGTNGTIVVPESANKTITVNGVGLNQNDTRILPMGVTWAGIEGGAYRLNVTSGLGGFDISAS